MKKQNIEYTKKNKKYHNVKAFSAINNKQLTTFFNSLPKEIVSKLNDSSHFAQSVLSNKNARNLLLLLYFGTMAMANDIPNPLYFDQNNIQYSFSTFIADEYAGKEQIARDFLQNSGKKLLAGSCGNVTLSNLIPVSFSNLWKDNNICYNYGFKFAKALIGELNPIFEDCVMNNILALQKSITTEACDKAQHQENIIVGAVLGSTFGTLFLIFAIMGLTILICHYRRNYQPIPSAPSNAANGNNPKSQIVNFTTDIDLEADDQAGYQSIPMKPSKML